eukprot:749351-Hanusia_phi.AAC.2
MHASPRVHVPRLHRLVQRAAIQDAARHVHRHAADPVRMPVSPVALSRASHRRHESVVSPVGLGRRQRELVQQLVRLPVPRELLLLAHVPNPERAVF